MKKVLMIFTTLISTTAFADCADLTGEYLCPEEAASELMLGSQDISLSYKNLLHGFIFKAGSSDGLRVRAILDDEEFASFTCKIK